MRDPALPPTYRSSTRSGRTLLSCCLVEDRQGCDVIAIADRLFLMCCLLLPLAGCRRGVIYTPDRLPTQYVAAPLQSPHRLNLSQMVRVTANSEQIYPGDLLSVAILTGMETDEQPEPPRLRVDESGQVSVPLVGMVPIAGLSLEAAERRICEESVRRGIYRAPNVTLALEQRRTRRVTVVGAVNEPGVIRLPSAESDLFAALVAAGGLADDASTFVEISRPVHSPTNASFASFPTPDPASSQLQSDRIDLLKLNDARDLQLDDGAVVMVVKQPRRSVQVMGLVQQPAELDMPADRDMRLLDAIAQAGGLTIQVANKVRVIRQVPGQPEPVVIQTSIRDAKLRGGANILLAAGDVVTVEETPTTFTVEMLRSFIRFGFTSSIPGM